MQSADFDRVPELISDHLNPFGFQTISDLLDRAFEQYPDNIAFSCLDVTLTFSELDHLSRAFAVYLQNEAGLRPGDRIAIQLPNILQYPVAAFGAIRAGLVVVNTNPLYTPREMKHQLSDSGARALVLLDSRLDLADELLAETPIELLIHTSLNDMQTLVSGRMVERSPLQQIIPLQTTLALGLGHTPTPADATPTSLAVLQYTGGTTGVAKGSMLTHSNLVANQLQITALLGDYLVPGQEIYIAPLPLYHIYAFTFHLLALFERGAHSVLIPNPSDLDSLITAASRWPFTGFAGINTLFVALCSNDAFRNLDFSSLKLTSSGGMALTRAAAELWRQVTGVTISEGYGLSETAPAVCLNRPSDPRVGTIGVTVADTEIQVIDDNGQPLPNGEIGELCVKGPQVMKGYWKRPHESAKVFLPGGWFRTGDMAMIQDDGLTRIVDRKKEMIIVSGFNVFPNEIEDVVSLHAKVRECAVIGMDDARTGERVRLYVVPEDAELSQAEVLEHCRKSLTPYKVPKEVIFCDQLPKSNVGKILRRVLKDQALSEAKAEPTLA
ncbi:AMP-binding protein [Marinobacter zhejiangensis]|uniref:Long-chain-fatty-acid--CoA ligase n=1 Tax=Marinobacter zhejiangensis TaxID=488535 RepID=A0A1I4TL89_9GAMM|nr:AMP-binding protein [Marinobacter zhejiangensis]SFM77494.1 long-chain acyl-CoA synthetase [Marinobacter zhejiangensis]